MNNAPFSLVRIVLLAGLLALGGRAWAVDLLPPLNDPPSGVSLPGKFTWFDLASPALREQMEYYRAVFGWDYRSPGRSDDGYVLVLNGGRPIGGMFSHDPPQGEQDGAVWIALMASADVDAAVRAVEAGGGQVEIPPAQVARRGRHALFRDPAGALFGVLQSASGDPPDSEVPVGGFLWVDLYAREPESMQRFYSALAPFEAETRPITGEVSRILLHAHGMPRAGIVPVDEEANRSAWVPYVRVDDVQATLDRAVDGGGFVIVAPDEAILDGNVAVFVDPNGAVIGIVKWDYEGGEGES